MVSTASTTVRKKTFRLGDDTRHDITRRRDIADQSTSFARDNASNVEIASRPCVNVLAANFFRPCLELILMTQPTLEVGIAEQSARIRCRPAITARQIENDRSNSLTTCRFDNAPLGLWMPISFLRGIEAGSHQHTPLCQ